jgi:PDZ domain-containing secreted protein
MRPGEEAEVNQKLKIKNQNDRAKIKTLNSKSVSLANGLNKSQYLNSKLPQFARLPPGVIKLG